MQKRKFRIGECAKHLNVERFVIRFWEKEFNLKTDRSIGGQRFYSEEDLAVFKKIKELLYQKGFTIAGARQHIFIHNESKIVASKKTNMDNLDNSKKDLLEIPDMAKKQHSHLVNQLCNLHEKLQKLKELL